jgi:hypothetical protein
MPKAPGKPATADQAILIVRADEVPLAYEWIAPAKYQQIARAKADEQWQQQFTPDPTPTEADDALNARADYHAGADEQMARVTEEGSSLEPDAAHHSSAELRPTPRSRPWLRGIVGLVLAACIIAAAFVSQSSYGDAARLLIARWTPEPLLARPTPQKPATP